MTVFRILLAAIFVAISVYTVPVVLDHGLNLLPVFFGDIAKFGWAGQFNLDFLCYLVMSATWLVWRNRFAPTGYALALGGLFLGAPFLTGYLMILSFRCATIAEVLTGERSSSH